MNRHIQVLLCVFFLYCYPGWGYAQKSMDNVAYADDQVRFTVITDGVIRMEWQQSGDFVDQPSLVAVNREYPKVDYRVKTGKRSVEIVTSKMRLTYKKGSGKFSADNLSVESVPGMYPFSWRPGMRQKGNLKGTFRTLDGLDGDVQTQTWCADMKIGEIRELEDGLLATDGWTLIDESENYLFDTDKDWSWVEERKHKDGIDWYFMAYGHDYKAALKDFTVFAGKIPLPPRYAFGYWWSRYWAYSDKEIRKLVGNFKNYRIPLDVLVIDMDWHYTDEGRGGWTGWTWNKSMFPDVPGFLGFLKDNGLKVTLNLHPASGFEAYEQCYPALAGGLGVDTASHARIDWVSSDKKLMSNVFSHVLHPMQKEGIDFWWLDWQQSVYDSRFSRLSNTWWINYCFFSDMERHGDVRPLLYHRWGGLGNHRYQVGFSGDAIISWNSLNYQPYFNSTASNVLYGYWSHDIGGHIGTGDGIDPEMYTRWLQFGAVSPVMRTHSSKDGSLNKEPWVFDAEVCDILRKTIVQRYALIPYIYTMARKAYDEGLSLCRPMYYDYPETKEAYDYRNEYMFGDRILVAPVTVPGKDGFAEMEVWLPEGDWYEWHTGTMLKGGKVLKRRFALDEYGIYVKAGSVLPMYGSDVEHLNNNDEDIIITVFPQGEGCFTMYEDGGSNKDYEHSFATTLMTSRRNGKELEICIHPRKGEYAGMPDKRSFRVKVLASEAPASVWVNGAPAAYRYCGEELAYEVDLSACSCDEKIVVKVLSSESVVDLTDGMIGRARRIGRMVERMKYTLGVTPVDELAEMGNLCESIEYRPQDLSLLADTFHMRYMRLPELLKKQKLQEKDIRWFLKNIGYE